MDSHGSTRARARRGSRWKSPTRTAKIRSNPTVAQPQILQGRKQELCSAHGDERRVASRGGIDHSRRPIDRGQSASVEDPADHGRGHTVTAADLEHTLFGANCKLINHRLKPRAHPVSLWRSSSGPPDLPPSESLPRVPQERSTTMPEVATPTSPSYWSPAAAIAAAGSVSGHRWVSRSRPAEAFAACRPTWDALER
jgi:hypothetical protein